MIPCQYGPSSTGPRMITYCATFLPFPPFHSMPHLVPPAFCQFLCRNALQAASSKGHESVVRLLVESGEDVNAQGGFYGNTLQAASSKGDESVVRLLLERGADVNAQDGKYVATLCSFCGGLKYQKVAKT